MVKASTSGTFFENAAIHLEYRTGFLGINDDFYENSATNNRVKVFRGTEFDNSTYAEARVTDINSSKLGFQLGSDYMATSFNRTELNTTFKQLLRVQLQIKDPSNETTPLTLSFNESGYFLINLYTLTASEPMSGNVYLYDNTNFENVLSVPFAPSPVINSITASATAGNNTHVVIEGSNFGESNFQILPRTPHQVSFKSSDYQGATAIDPMKKLEFIGSLDNSDYQSWTDTLIEFVLPSFVWAKDEYGHEGALTPGTGRFKVKNIWGKETLSEASKTISVQYGLQSVITIPKKQMLIPRANCTDGVKFRVSTAILNNSNKDIMKAISKAFNDWSSALGIVVDFERDALGNILTGIGEAIDGQNVIYYDANVTGMGTLTHRSNTGFYNCGTYEGRNVGGLKDVDIAINPNESWDYSLTQTSISGVAFYDAILHELGHALGLTHSLETNDLMLPTLNRDPSNSKRRTLNSGSGYALAGANMIVQLSESSSWNCGSSVETLNSLSTNCLPEIPKSLTASAVSSSIVDLSWGASKFATSYVLESSTNAGSGFSAITTTNTTSFSNTSLAASTTYYYRVKARNANGDSNYSSVTSSTTLTSGTGSTTPPLSPGNATGYLLSPSEAYISWIDNSSNETGFIIERSTTSGSGYVAIATVGANVTSYTDATINQTSNYFYKVTAYNSNGNSSYTEEIDISGCLQNLPETVSLCGSFVSGFNNTSNLFSARNIASCTNVSNSIIHNGAIVIAQASQEINLDPGFEAESGSRFEAMIVSECSQLKSSTVVEADIAKVDNLKENINVFPNPVKETLHIQFNLPYETVNNIVIYSISGAKLFESGKFNIMEGDKAIDVSTFKSGIYVMNIYSNDRDSNFKIVVK